MTKTAANFVINGSIFSLVIDLRLGKVDTTKLVVHSDRGAPMTSKVVAQLNYVSSVTMIGAKAGC